MMKFAALIFASVLALAVANAEEASPTPAASPSASPAASPKPAAPKKKKEKKPKDEKKSEGAEVPKDVKKLIVQDTVPGTGKEAKRGKTIKVNYTGWLYDPGKSMGRGKQFDTSIGSEPFTFELGAGRVIKGWDEGFDGMKVGGKRKLIIPSEMGYGARGAGTVIPPNSPLMFEVELVDVM